MDPIVQHPQHGFFSTARNSTRMSSAVKPETIRGREVTTTSSRLPWAKTGLKSWCTWKKALIIVGIIVAVVLVVAVIVIPIYITQYLASQTTTTTAATVSLPTQCSNYTINTDFTRLVTYTATTSACDSIFSSPTWVRFMGMGGTQITASIPPSNRCGSNAAGWLVSPHPTTTGSSTAGLVCFNWSNNACNAMVWITVTNCNGFFVYLLTNSPACTSRYCTV